MVHFVNQLSSINMPVDTFNYCHEGQTPENVAVNPLFFPVSHTSFPTPNMF